MMKSYALVICLFFCQICSLSLGEQIDGHSLSTLETPHFKIFHDVNAQEADGIACVLELAYKHFNEVFTCEGFSLNAPEDKLVWYCFNEPQAFASHALASDDMNIGWLTSYYSAKTNSVSLVKPCNMVNWRMDKKTKDQPSLAGVYIMPSVDNSANELTRIMHETAHQLAFNTGIQKQKVMYPIWASEGLACNFENCIPSPDANIRQQRLIRMYRENRMIPLSEFILTTQMTEDSALRKDIYAQSYVFFKFLSEKHSQNLSRYMSNLYQLRTGWRSRAALNTEFISAFGSIKEINKSWQNYLKTISKKD